MEEEMKCERRKGSEVQEKRVSSMKKEKKRGRNEECKSER